VVIPEESPVVVALFHYKSVFFTVIIIWIKKMSFSRNRKRRVKMNSLKKYWALIEDVLSGTFLSLGISLIFYETVMRFLFSSSQAWIGEVSIYLIIWGALFGIAVALRNRRHVQIDFLYDLMKPFYRRIIDLFSVSVGIIFCVFFIYYGGNLVMHNYETGMASMNARIPMWIVYFILPISGTLFLLRFIEQFIHVVKRGELNDDSTV